MTKNFDPHAIVEIPLTSGLYVMSARTTRALGVKPEQQPAPSAVGGGKC
jgi:hypothetical protein